MCVPLHLTKKTNTAFHKKNIIPTVKHGGGSVIVSGCFAASGPGRLAIIDGTMNSALYQKILKENIRTSEWAKTPPQRCERVSASYRKHLIAVVDAKGGTTSY